MKSKLTDTQKQMLAALEGSGVSEGCAIEAVLHTTQLLKQLIIWSEDAKYPDRAKVAILFLMAVLDDRNADRACEILDLADLFISEVGAATWLEGRALSADRDDTPS